MTPRQARFAAEYLVDLNATQAAIRAGYAARSARQVAARLLTKDDVAEAVAKGRAAQVEKLDVEAVRVLRELGRLATSDFRKCFDADGNLLSISRLPDDVAAAIAGVEVVRRSGGKDEPDEYVHKIKLWDKNTALQNLAKHFGLLKDLVEHTGKGGGPIEVLDLSKLSTETLERIKAEMAAKGGG